MIKRRVAKWIRRDQKTNVKFDQSTGNYESSLVYPHALPGEVGFFFLAAPLGQASAASSQSPYAACCSMTPHVQLRRARLPILHLCCHSPQCKVGRSDAARSQHRLRPRRILWRRACRDCRGGRDPVGSTRAHRIGSPSHWAGNGFATMGRLQRAPGRPTPHAPAEG